MNEIDTETLPVSCLNGIQDLSQLNLRYGQCAWPTDPVLFEINAKLDKILEILNNTHT